MGFVATLLDKYKKATNTGSDNALADAFGVSRQTVSQWRSGIAYPKDDKIVDLATGASEDPQAWLVALQAERATGSAATAWKKLARTLGIAAALVVALFATSHDVKANNSQNRILQNANVVDITHRLIRMARLLLRSIRYDRASVC